MLKLKLLFIFSFIGFAALGVDDSTGVILKNSKVFILHKVEAGQGLYGVARRYKTVWTKIRDANPGSDKSLLTGQILLVPTGKTEDQFFGNKTPKYSKNNGEYSKPDKPKVTEKEPSPDPVDVDKSPKTSFTVFYTVKKGETLFSIAQKFGTTVDFLKQLNKMKSDEVSDGQDILVPMTESSHVDTIIAQKEAEAKRLQKELDDMAAKIEAEKKREQEKNDSEKITETKIIVKETETKKDDAKPVVTKTEYTIVTENYPEYDIEKVTETGHGQVMKDNTINQAKDWVIHHNAPENTVILITNPANNKTIYAKVVKNFTKNENDALILYITKNTADYLELNKKDKFAVKISFAK